MKNKKGLIAVLIIGLVLIIAGILVFFLIPKKSNSELYTDALKKSLGLVSNESGIEEKIKEIQTKLEKNNYKLTLNSEQTQDEAGYKRSEDIIYFGDKKLYFVETVSQNDVTSVFEGMIKDNRFYIKIKDYLKNVYYTDKLNDFIKEIKGNSDNYEALDKIEDYLVDAFLESIKNKEVTIGSSDLKINGSTYKTKLYSYTFTGETLRDIIVNFCEKLKDDKDFYKTLNTLLKSSGAIQEKMNLNKEAVDAILDQLIFSADELKSMGKILTYSIYMYKDEPIGVIVSSNNKDDLATIEYYNVVNDDKQYIKFSSYSNSDEEVTVVFDEKTKDNGEISITMNKKEVIKGYLKNNDENYELKLYGVEDEDSYLLININKDRSGSIRIVSDKANISYNYKLEQVDEIPEMDVTNSVPFDEMPEDDYNRFQALVGSVLQMFQSEKEIYSDYYEANGLDI